MKATALLKTIADLIAENGDLEVYLRTVDERYSKLNGKDFRVSTVHRVKGKLTEYVDGKTAASLGYDLQDHVHGIVLR